MHDRNFFNALANQKRREFSQNWINRNLPHEGVCMALSITFIARQARKEEKRPKPDVLFLQSYSKAAQQAMERMIDLIDAEHFTSAIDGKQEKPAGGHGSNDRHTMVGLIQSAIAQNIVARKPAGDREIPWSAKQAGIEKAVAILTDLELIATSDAPSPVGNNKDVYWYVSDTAQPHAWAASASVARNVFKLFDPNHGRIKFGSAKELIEKMNEYREPGYKFMRFEYR